MSYQALVIKVMIASPSDVKEERGIIREIISEWNAINSEKEKIVLMPVGWESHSYPIMGDRPQEIINYQLLEECDLLVATFWTRFGSPTGVSPSGTAEEIEKHLGLGKPAMIYFSNTPIRPDSVDEMQYKPLQEFKEKCKISGLIENYESKDEFRDKFRRQISKIINDYYSNESNDIALHTERISNQEIILSNEAKELLIEATNSKDGAIIRAEYSGGMDIEANNRNFVQNNTARERALWDGALKELENNSLVEAMSYKRTLFTVTRLGYELADRLKQTWSQKK